MILSKDKAAIDCLKEQFACEYDMLDLGEACWILGMELIQDHDRHTIELSQCHYIESILKHFGMADSHPIVTPLDPNVKLTKLENTETDIKEYQSALGSLMYAMLATCPDLTFAVGILSRHTATPGHVHVTVLKHVYHYLRKTSTASLIFHGDA